MIFALALKHWKLVLAGLGAALLLGTTVYYKTGRDHWKRVATSLRFDLDEARDRTMREIASHKATKLGYEAAQAEAARLEKERLARVTAQQKDITDARAQSTSAALAAARATADRLRREASSRAYLAGKGVAVAVPGVPGAASGTDGAAVDQGLSIAERLTATEQAIRLEGLQGWVRDQQAVPVN